MTDREGQTPRRRYQALQASARAAYAAGEADSGGREVPETEHPYRTCYQRDRDRVVHCSAFRRLDFKTQVFVPHEHDHFRTRLTHTLEVAQIARDLGRALGLNEDLIEAVALGHDLGHPPFGHGGEKALDELMVGHGGFEHNCQSLRIVEHLEHPYPQFGGLNLTTIVRECLAKHQTKYDAPIHCRFLADQQAPMEGQIVDLADEIAYTAADLEDALASGLLRAEQLAHLEVWQQAWAAAEANYPDAGPVHKRIRATKAVLAMMADDLIVTTSNTICQLGITSLSEVRRAGRRIVDFSGPLRRAMDQLQEFLEQSVYLAGENARQSARAVQIVSRLFGAYVEDVSLLPERYRRRISSPAQPAPISADSGMQEDSVYRVVCDYIAGMTDRFCRKEHERLFGRPA